MSAVLDASALLALLNDEPGAERVAAAIPGAVLGAVNLAEVAGKLIEGGMPEDDARRVLRSLGLRVEPLDEDAAYPVGALALRERLL